MRNHSNDDDPVDRESEEPQDDEALTDSALQTEAEVTCPYCGEMVSIVLDPDGGVAQEYVEDCQVCCRPWSVQVSYDEQGTADVAIEQAH